MLKIFCDFKTKQIILLHETLTYVHMDNFCLGIWTPLFVKVHEKMHTGEARKKIMCNECGKWFASPISLKE